MGNEIKHTLTSLQHAWVGLTCIQTVKQGISILEGSLQEELLPLSHSILSCLREVSCHLNCLWGRKSETSYNNMFMSLVEDHTRQYQ